MSCTGFLISSSVVWVDDFFVSYSIRVFRVCVFSCPLTTFVTIKIFLGSYFFFFYFLLLVQPSLWCLFYISEWIHFVWRDSLWRPHLKIQFMILALGCCGSFFLRSASSNWVLSSFRCPWTCIASILVRGLSCILSSGLLVSQLRLDCFSHFSSPPPRYLLGSKRPSIKLYVFHGNWLSVDLGYTAWYRHFLCQFAVTVGTSGLGARSNRAETGGGNQAWKDPFVNVQQKYY